MEEDRPEEPAEPAEKPVEAVEPAEPAGPAEPPVEPPTPKPKTVRIRKPKPVENRARDVRDADPHIVMPEIDDRFWANLLRTQRDAERATKLQRISEFNLL